MPFFWLLYLSLIGWMIALVLEPSSPPPKEAPGNSQYLPSQSGGGGRLKPYRVVTDYFDGD